MTVIGALAHPENTPGISSRGPFLLGSAPSLLNWTTPALFWCHFLYAHASLSSGVLSSWLFLSVRKGYLAQGNPDLGTIPHGPLPGRVLAGERSLLGHVLSPRPMTGCPPFNRFLPSSPPHTPCAAGDPCCHTSRCFALPGAEAAGAPHGAGGQGPPAGPGARGRTPSY